MEIFIDSADIEEIEQVFQWSIVNGITTNPSLSISFITLKGIVAQSAPTNAASLTCLVLRKDAAKTLVFKLCSFNILTHFSTKSIPETIPLSFKKIFSFSKPSSLFSVYC